VKKIISEVSKAISEIHFMKMKCPSSTTTQLFSWTYVLKKHFPFAKREQEKKNWASIFSMPTP